MSAGPQAPAEARAVCPRCGARFACDPDGDCWCKAEPPRRPVPGAAAACLCPRCLAAGGKASEAGR
jgi:hypothetical protein